MPDPHDGAAASDDLRTAQTLHGIPVFAPARSDEAGAQEPILDQRAIEAVHELSYGIPRKIGAITEQALTYAMFANKRNVTADMVLKVKNLEG